MTRGRRGAIHSMTGFGRAVVRLAGGRLSVEIQTVNNRALQAKFRLPEALLDLERPLRKRLDETLARGSVLATVVWSAPPAAQTVRIDRTVLAAYLRQIRAAGRVLRVPGGPTWGALLALPGVVTDARGTSLEIVRRATARAFDGALARLTASRRAEGRALARALAGHIARLERHVADLEKRQKPALAEATARLAGRLAAITGAAGGRPSADILREAAIQVERADTAEEITRIRGHCARFRRSLAAGGPVGRTLDFLSQELVRETNTLVSKTQAAALVGAALAAKEEATRLREQSANVE